MAIIRRRRRRDRDVSRSHMSSHDVPCVLAPRGASDIDRPCSTSDRDSHIVTSAIPLLYHRSVSARCSQLDVRRSLLARRFFLRIGRRPPPVRRVRIVASLHFSAIVSIMMGSRPWLLSLPVHSAAASRKRPIVPKPTAVRGDGADTHDRTTTTDSCQRTRCCGATQEAKKEASAALHLSSHVGGCHYRVLACGWCVFASSISFSGPILTLVVATCRYVVRQVRELVR